MRVLSFNVYFYIPYSFNQPLLSGERIWWRKSHNELRLILGRLTNEEDDVGGVRGTYGRSGIACIIFGPEICRKDTICKLGIAGNILKWILQENRRSWDSLVVVVTKLRAGRSGVRIPAAERDFFFTPKHLGGLRSSPSLHFHWYRSYLPGVHLLECGVYNPTPSSFEVTYTWSLAFYPLTWLPVVDRGSFTCIKEEWCVMGYMDSFTVLG
jgi:hypothetical protein